MSYNTGNISESDLLLILVNQSCTNPNCPNLASGPWYLVQSIILFLSSCLALPLNLFVVKVLRTSACVHANVKLLLINAGVANSLLSLHHVGQSIYNFVWSVDLRMATQFGCSLYQTLNTIATYGSLFSVSGIAVERFVASTVRKGSLSSDIEKSEKGVRIYAVICWLIGVAFFASSFSASVALEACICYCHRTILSDAAMFYFKMALSVLVEFASIALCVVVRKLSTSILSAAHRGGKANSLRSAAALNTLTERYQLHRNVNTMSMLCPALVSHCVFYLLAVFLRLPVYDWLSFKGVGENGDDIGDNANLAVHLLLVNMQSVILVCCLHPLLIVRNNAVLSKALVKKWPKISKIFFGLKTQNADKTAATLTTIKALTVIPLPNIVQGGQSRREENNVACGDQKENVRTATSSRSVVAVNNRSVTDYRLAAAGGQEMVWETFWKQ